MTKITTGQNMIKSEFDMRECHAPVPPMWIRGTHIVALGPYPIRTRAPSRVSPRVFVSGGEITLSEDVFFWIGFVPAIGTLFLSRWSDTRTD